MTTKTMLGLVILAIGLSIIPAFAEIATPYQQFSNGTPINQIQCRDSMILMESPRNTPACVNESSIEKLENKGFILVDVVSVVELKIKLYNFSNSKRISPKLEEDLMFQISSNDEFSGELYGHYNPTHLRRPAPYNASQNFHLTIMTYKVFPLYLLVNPFHLLYYLNLLHHLLIILMQLILSNGCRHTFQMDLN